jgi:hypothetical protein
VSRATAAALVAVALGIAIVLVWRRPPATIPSAGRPTPVEPAAVPRSPASPPPATPAPTAAERPAEAASAPEAERPAEDAPPAAPVDDTRSIVGSIVVTDVDGSEHRFESGSLTLHVWSGDNAHAREIEVASGAWRADVSRRARLEVWRIELGGRAAVWVHDEDRLRVPDDGVIELRARWPSASILHVRDAATRREFSSVEIAERSSQWTFETSTSPLPRGRKLETIAKGLASPIDVGRALAEAKRQGDAASRTLWLRSPGFAWGSLEVDLGAGGERFLDLVPGGDLDVHLAGAIDVTGCRLRVRASTGGAVVTQMPLGSERDVSIESVPARPCVVSIELGESVRDAVVLGSTEAIVVAGRRTRVTIVVADKPIVPTERIAGTIRVSKAWHAGKLDVSANSDDAGADLEQRMRFAHFEERRDDGEFHVFPFAFESVRPGHYELEVRRPAFAFAVDASEGSREDLVLEIPPPGRVSLRAIDVATGRDAPVDEIDWHAPWPPGMVGSRTMEHPTEGTSRFEFDSPLGPIEIWCSDDEWTCEPLFVTVREGRNDAVMKVAATARFRVQVVDGEMSIPWNDRWNVQPAAVDGDGSLLSWSGNLFVVSRPGRYRFAFPKLDGYRAVPEQEVVVEADRATEHVIHLERE